MSSLKSTIEQGQIRLRKVQATNKKKRKITNKNNNNNNNNNKKQ